MYFNRNPALASPALKEIAFTFPQRLELKLENVALLSLEHFLFHF